VRRSGCFPAHLAICRDRLSKYESQGQLFEQQFEDMQLPRQYGMIFVPGGSFGHLYEFQTINQCLVRVYQTLLPGGWFVFDVRPPAYMSQFGKDGEVDYELDHYADGSTVFTTGYWQHLDDGRIIRKWNKMERFVDNVLIETEVFDYRERLFDIDDLKPVLKQTGFDPITITKAYDSGNEPVGSDGIVFRCQKPNP
jgi:hypothetical protein